MNQETIYLVELTDSTGTVHRFCTGTGYMSKPTDTPPNAYYSPRVDQPGLFRQNMFAVGTTSGSSTGGYGEITLLNTDGGLDGFIDLGFDGQTCVVKEGHPGDSLADFATITTGTPEQPETSWSMVTIRIKDNTAKLNTPAQSLHYAGDNALPDGIEGTAELKDKPKPRLFGICNNVTPVCVNTSKLIYQVNSGPVYDIPAVHDGGNVGQIVKGADYATSTLLLAAVVPAVTNPPTAPGQYLTCLAEGLFRLDAAPFMQITCDVIEGATAAARTAGQIIKALAAEKVTAANVATQPIIDLDKAAPYEVGVYTGTNDMTTSALLDILCASVGAWFGFDNLGIFWAKQLTAPDAAQAVMTLTQAENITIDRVATADGDRGVPVWRVNVDFARNWTVQNSGLAGSVAGNQLTFEPENTDQLTVDRKNLLAMEYLRTKAEDAAIKTLHVLAPEITVKTTLNALADANTEAARVLALRKVRRDRLNTKLPMTAVQYPAGGYWDDEAISEMPEARQLHAAVVHGNWLYVIGGSTGAVTASVIRLDLSNPTSTWDDAGVTDLPVARRYHTAVIHNNWLYVIGGFTTSRTASVIRLDLTNPAGAWDDAGVTDLPEGVYTHSSAIYGDWLYVTGGNRSTGKSAKTLRLDLSSPTGAWDDAGVTDLPEARDNHASAIYDNWLYIVGGLTTSRSPVVIRLDLTNPAGVWDDAGVSDLSDGINQPSLVIKDNWLYLIGGSTSTTPALATVPRLDLYNPAAGWRYTDIVNLPAGRSQTASIHYGETVYVIGGYTTVVQSNTWRYRTNSNPEDAAHRTSLGRTILVKHPRYGYTAGRAMKIIGTESDYRNRTITMELWG